MYFSYIYLAHKHIRFRRWLCIYCTYWNVCDYDLLCFSSLRRLNLICTHEYLHTHFRDIMLGFGDYRLSCYGHLSKTPICHWIFITSFRGQVQNPDIHTHTYLTAEFLRICTFMFWWWWTRPGATCPYGHLYDMKYYIGFSMWLVFAASCTSNYIFIYILNVYNCWFAAASF